MIGVERSRIFRVAVSTSGKARSHCYPQQATAWATSRPLPFKNSLVYAPAGDQTVTIYTKFTPCLWSEALWLASPCRGSQRDSVSYILHTHSRSHHTFSQQSATVWTERCCSSPHPPLVTLSNSPISLVLWAICSVVYRKEPSRCLLVLFLFSGLFETCVVMQ